ncbi:HAMP domain-containing sensor histidine kinase [Methylobacterium sp. NEAU 140]|uniref:sensor histidine kinase n=1 Tax=Methylobacterium sp. NEAU 140 TaxID=3064945 RepID=UPI00273295FF|nr:HAMP domain-containing sensor histidine kinase [Methylobacterium sp. NEAU 140]MDP4025959.1 HAMP domain-containing sensor histidine kinase [Methylobacterium sp. NEAU 140]
MGRIGLLGRIMLILMAALTAVIVAAIAIGRYERAATPPPFATPYPRLDQAAGVIDLVRRADPSLRPAILRAVSGPHLRVTLQDAAPPETEALRRAPRIEATLRAFAPDAFPDPGDGDGLRAYVDADARPASRFATEGRPARIVWRTGDGRVLVLDEAEAPRGLSLRLFGLAPGLWIGILGIAAAGLALYGAQREMRPLRRLTAAASAFDGSPPAGPVPVTGAPDMRRLARAVHAMQERVAGLLQERSFLIGAISHDLKTYLTRLRLRAEGIAEAGQRARMAADIEAMTALIETALAFARGTTVSRARERVDLADLAAIEAAERCAVGQPVALIDGETEDAAVDGDAVALRRVLANLVDNAVKFGRGRVEIAVAVEPATCRVHVDDDGPGVGEAQAAAIFSPFYRIEGSRSRGTGGSGLGLAIARQIAEAHGGALRVSTGHLGGARFTLSLPRAGASA